MSRDERDPAGWVVLVRNAAGVVVACGPYLSEHEAHEVASFAASLCSDAWLVDLDGDDGKGSGSIERYGMDEVGLHQMLPERFVPRPTRSAAKAFPATPGPAAAPEEET